MACRSWSSPLFLASNELALVGDLLLRVSKGGEDYASNALFHVSSPSRFAVRVQPTGSGCNWKDYDGNMFLMGIAPHDADMTCKDISVETGIFLSLPYEDEDECEIYHTFHVDDDVTLPPVGYLTLPGWESCKDSQTPLLMEYENQKLWFSFEGHARAEIRCITGACIPPGDYRPCISVFDLSVRFRVVVDPCGKRKREDDASEEAPRTSIARTLWTSRKFPDAAVACGAQNFPVHRGVLAAASPFFESAFEGKMRESNSATVVLEDAEPDAVEAMLAYMYTGDVGDYPNAAALLLVAHRLEVSRLVDHCASLLFERVNEQNVVDTVCALRPYRDDPTVKPHWDMIVRRIMSQEPLVRMVVANLKT